MAKGDIGELLDLARGYFRESKHAQAERLLQQILLLDNRNPEVFHMLATIYYDQGKFNKAIKTFRRALEIDPGFTDASVGLSIILNDLGKYDEGRKVFEEAQSHLHKARTQSDPYIDEKLATKHDELGELYAQYGRTDEALEQYFKAYQLTHRKGEIMIKIADSFVKKGDTDRAIRELRNVVKDQPKFTPARVRLGVLLYNSNKVLDAVETWEGVLLRDPENPEAKRLIRMAQEAGIA
jgi:tetratricopeptide (TPR) repeat protein